MDDRTRASVLAWLATHGGDIEALARWMRDSLRVGGLGACRELIAQALTK